jgi:hypothetical protein
MLRQNINFKVDVIQDMMISILFLFVFILMDFFMNLMINIIESTKVLMHLEKYMMKLHIY